MKISELMTRPVVTCHADDPMSCAAQRMWEHDIGALPVVDGDEHVVAVITDRDICMAAYTQGHRLRDIIIGQVMARHPIACHERDSAADVAALMKEHQVHRIPVIDAERRVVGIVSLNDLARTGTAVPHATIVDTLAAIARPRPEVSAHA
jgi:CBS domain-containing protein